MAYDFHYTPTGTGVISGKEVLEQTEDAINDLGNTAISGVQEALDKAEQALTNSENAVDDAQTALNTANNAEGVAIQAQTDVGNLSGTVTNIGNRVTTAEGNITNLQGRMTTAEGNITNLQGRMTTAETNIGNLQTAVSTAQATANSAQQTATTARQQSYVFRYSSTVLVDSSTNSNALLDNTDNLKVGDKVIDSSGVLFSITAIDTQNSTFTIGTALIDLAQDSDVVHKSGNETISGTKTFLDIPIPFKSSTAELGVTGGNTKVFFTDKNLLNLAGITFGNYGSSKLSYCRFSIYDKDSNNQEIENFIEFSYINNNQLAYFRPNRSNFVTLGTINNRWNKVYADEYYYGSNNVEFSSKFVTTDTAQTISGVKTFTDNPLVGNSNTNITISNRQITANGSASTTGNHAYSFMQLQSKVTYADSSSPIYVTVTLEINEDAYTDGRSSAFYPNSNNFTNLGKSGKRWANVYTYKINSVEPSSLSLPVFPSQSSWIDISSYITDMTGGVANNFTPPANGYITFSATGTQAQIFSDYGLQSKFSIQVGSTIRGYHPVLKNEAIKIYILASSIDFFRFIPCQGNV